MDWPQTIRNLATDRQQSLRQLSADLGVSQQFLSDVVNGKKAATWRLKLSVLAAIGYDGPRDELFELLLSEEAADAARKWEIDRGVERAELAAAKRESAEAREAVRKEKSGKKKPKALSPSLLRKTTPAH